MANWCNLRLIATGHANDLKPFRLAAGALRGRIKARHSDIFTEEMEYGECGDLEADGIRRFRGQLRSAVYRLQGRNTDYVEHFRYLSQRFPRLAFVLVVSDPNSDIHGSYCLLNGRRRWWSVPHRVERQIFARRYREYGAVDENGTVDYDHEYADVAEWDAFFEMMDVAEAKWNQDVLRWIRQLPSQKRRGTRPSRETRIVSRSRG
jgi:hypothetical protein